MLEFLSAFKEDQVQMQVFDLISCCMQRSLTLQKKPRLKLEIIESRDLHDGDEVEITN